MKPAPDLLTGQVAFTGRLASMKRADAFALVRKAGGAPRRAVSRQTAVLVVGSQGWPLLADGRPAVNFARAKELGVPIVGERSFLEWVGRAAPDGAAKSYTAEKLASLSGLTVGAIEKLSLVGLIGHGEHFGFADLAAARQLAQLLAAGVKLSTITRTLMGIRKWLPGADLAQLRLFAESEDELLVGQLQGKTNRDGQFVLPVAQKQDDADEIFERAQAAEAAGTVEEAERLYRRVMKIDAGDPAAPFNLGNLLRAEGRAAAAEAAFRKAVAADPRFPEAWYNLADLLDERGETGQALAALDKALAVDPAYADALFNAAHILQRGGRFGEAAERWRRYLALDPASEWATRARRGLKLCEMELAASQRS